MLESFKAKVITWAASQKGKLLQPANHTDREIVESMFMDGAPVTDINKYALQLWQERQKEKQPFVNDYTPVAETKNGQLHPQTKREFREELRAE